MLQAPLLEALFVSVVEPHHLSDQFHASPRLRCLAIVSWGYDPLPNWVPWPWSNPGERSDAGHDLDSLTSRSEVSWLWLRYIGRRCPFFRDLTVRVFDFNVDGLEILGSMKNLRTCTLRVIDRFKAGRARSNSDLAAEFKTVVFPCLLLLDVPQLSAELLVCMQCPVLTRLVFHVPTEVDILNLNKSFPALRELVFAANV